MKEQPNVLSKPILTLKEVAKLLGYTGKYGSPKALRLLLSIEKRTGKKILIKGVVGLYKKNDKRDSKVVRYYVNRATLEYLLSSDNNLAFVDLIEQLRQEIKDLKYRLENLEQKE